MDLDVEAKKEYAEQVGTYPCFCVLTALTDQFTISPPTLFISTCDLLAVAVV
jgi:hypothetical protein